jgi:hypothetical protein
LSSTDADGSAREGNAAGVVTVRAQSGEAKKGRNAFHVGLQMSGWFTLTSGGRATRRADSVRRVITMAMNGRRRVRRIPETLQVE